MQPDIGAHAPTPSSASARATNVASDDVASLHDLDEIAAQGVEVPAPPREEDTLYPVVYAGDLAKPLEPVKWLCRKVNLAAGRPILLSGYGDVGKTLAAQEMLLAVASGHGTIWGQHEIQLRGRALHIDYEMGLEATRWRYQRLSRGMGFDLGALGQMLGVVSLPPLYLTDPKAEEVLLRRLDGVAIALVDNLAASSRGLDENSAEAAAPLYLLNRVSSKTGTVVLFLHHEMKATEGVSASKRIRGSGSIHAAVGGGIAFSRAARGIIKCEPSKSAMGEPPEPFWFGIEDVGSIDPNTGRSEGLKFIWVPEEQASEAVNKERADATSAVRNARALILSALKNGNLSTTEMHQLQGVGGKTDHKKAAIKELIAEGRIVVVSKQGTKQVFGLAPGAGGDGLDDGARDGGDDAPR